MNILDKIIAHKTKEVAERKSLYPVKLLEKSIYFASPTVSLCQYLSRENSSGIIAEFKRASPSAGPIHPYAKPEIISLNYMQAGAAALSVITDEKFFSGRLEDLKTARSINFCPILRKDFIIEEYQIVEARSAGADVILLIAAALQPERLKALAQFAKSLGLEVLVEVTNQTEIEAGSTEFTDLMGVNNRNLKDFSIDIERSIQLLPSIPKEFIQVSESGLSEPENVNKLQKAGYKGFLIGSHFMRQANPGDACKQFIKEVAKLQVEAV